MHQCCQQVLLPQMLHWRQCKNNGTVKRCGEWYCGVHDPEKINERQEKRDKKRKKKRDQQRNLHIAHLALKQKKGK